MKTLHIVFTSSRKFFPIGSWVIRWWTKKPYSHVAVMLPLENINMYYQANDGKINFECPKEFLSKHKIKIEHKLEIPNNIFSNMLENCLLTAGNPYGFWQNIGIALIDILRYFNIINVKNPFTAGANCSETIYKQIILPIYGDLGYDKDSIKPQDIEEILKTKQIPSL